MALLMALPFLPWAWLVSSRLDKDARWFHLNHRMWNGIHMAAGLAALAAMLFVPIIAVGWVIGILILLGPILVYWQVRNKAVPENQRFALSGGGLSAALEARRKARATQHALLQFTDAAGRGRQVPLKEDPAFPVHMLAEDLLAPAVAARAARVEMAVGQSGTVISQVIDGMRYKRDPVPPDQAMLAVDYLKEIAGLDVADRRRRQAGPCRMTGPSGRTDLTITTWGSSNGLNMRIDFDRAKRVLKPFDSLGLLPPQLECFRRLEPVEERHGLVLIGAPPGHGLTTTMYSALARHDAYTSNIKSLEREIEAAIDGVDQIAWDPDNKDVDYATNLQSILRRDPDMVMLDELKDAETARRAAEPGMEGPLMYIPQRASSISEQIREWVKLVGDVKTAARPLRLVSNQRLLRSLCPHCRQPFQPTVEQLKSLGIAPGKVQQLYQASGKIQVKNKIEPCPVCGGTGYLGQTGAFEVFAIDDEARKVLASGDLKAALAHARRNKMIYLQEAALTKVISGQTSIEEVMRVMAAARDAAPVAAGGSAARPAPTTASTG
jgi:type II secretory ATPase GspE/PulE/Tfp pilus assembly ATPase PilB-like protein